MRKLATIRKIERIEPIEGADRIELAIVDGWQVVVQKQLHEPGALIVYCEIDSFLPIRPEFEFLRKSCYRKMADGTEGFRIKTIKLRGQISQGLILPIRDVFNNYDVIDDCLILRGKDQRYGIGDDVSELLNITKYEIDLPVQLSGVAKGKFPSFLIRTDEERIQNLTRKYEEFKQHDFFVTEKLDGTSFTCYLREDQFGVCSRNLELIEDDTNQHWQVARKLDLEEKLRELKRTTGRDLCVQGELIGPGIQSNRYGLSEPELHVFNIFDVNEYGYLHKTETMQFVEVMKLKEVPLLHPAFTLPETIGELLQFAEGKSVLNPKVEREGIVLVSGDGNDRISFKAISNKFLLKTDE